MLEGKRSVVPRLVPKRRRACLQIHTKVCATWGVTAHQRSAQLAGTAFDESGAIMSTIPGQRISASQSHAVNL
jgi:hypothetical protein